MITITLLQGHFIMGAVMGLLIGFVIGGFEATKR